MKKLISFFTLILIFSQLQAQEKVLTFDDILQWNKIKNYSISNDGNYVAYTLQPNKGNPTLKVSTIDGKEILSSQCGDKAKFTADSKFLLYTLQPSEDTIRQLKLKKEKKENFPLNKLIIYHLKTKKSDTVHYLKNYKLPLEWSNWIAYQSDNKKDTTIAKKKKDSYHLTIKNLSTKKTTIIPNVQHYNFADEKPVITYNSLGKDSTVKAAVYVHQLEKNTTTRILQSDYKLHRLTINNTGEMVAFVNEKSKENELEQNELYLWNKSDSAKVIVASNNDVLTDNQTVSQHKSISFSKNNEKLYFGISKAKEPKDTTVLDEEIAKLDIWVWNEEQLQSEQLKNRKNDLKKAYLSVYHIGNKKTVQLGKEKFSSIKQLDKGNSHQLLAWSNRPYGVQKMWEGGPYHTDFYLVNDKTGMAQKIKTNIRATPQTSTNGKYIYWHSAVDTSLYTYAVATGKTFRITTPKQVQLANELHDTPNMPAPYGLAGWTKNDDAMLVYDRFDIWKVHPENKTQPVNITKNGRKNNIAYRLVRFDKNYPNFNNKNVGINLKKPLFLIGHNEQTREDAYYQTNVGSNDTPQVLWTPKYCLNYPVKAQNADAVIFTKEDFQTYPDLIASTIDFKNFTKISNAAPQQKDFKWGTVELVSWTSMNGKKLEGMLYKPENFDPNKKYPMIVNFYEKSSQGLLRYRVPDIGRSTIGYHYYTGNGYIIFNPDVHYGEGYPGEDAYNCVMPGISHLIAKGFVDVKKIGVQGHSWGGYQTAYLATRTNLFAAIESGAPVVNMFSAYGGIRLWSGRNRSFQYEKGQSRIGKSIWEAPQRYFTNSPLFHLDKVETPILIMHNDDDGAVPFLQGVEMFIALRRLQKPAWLLNYNEADHWPTRMVDRIDFQKRMAQFFNHYLKDAPMPRWMKKGIPATEKGKEMDYKLEEH